MPKTSILQTYGKHISIYYVGVFVYVFVCLVGWLVGWVGACLFVWVLNPHASIELYRYTRTPKPCCLLEGSELTFVILFMFFCVQGP